MKANELRIGNLVRHTNRNGTFDLSINNINKIGAGLVYGNGDWFIQFKEIEPIPLTEEWLIKMGFKHVNTLHDSTKVFEGEPFLYYKDGYARISIHTPDILYVHQLQNLYFALTGEELEVKND